MWAVARFAQTETSQQVSEEGFVSNGGVGVTTWGGRGGGAKVWRVAHTCTHICACVCLLTQSSYLPQHNSKGPPEDKIQYWVKYVNVLKQNKFHLLRKRLTEGYEILQSEWLHRQFGYSGRKPINLNKHLDENLSHNSFSGLQMPQSPIWECVLHVWLSIPQAGQHDWPSSWVTAATLPTDWPCNNMETGYTVQD